MIMNNYEGMVESTHCSTCECEGCSGSRRIPSTPPAPALHEEVAEGEREGGVETFEVPFVPLEGDLEVISDDEDVMIEEDGVVVDEGDAAEVEKLEVEGEGDVPREEVVLDEGDVKWDGGDRRMMEYVAEDMEKGGEGNDGQENFLWNQRLMVARFWRTQVDAYEGRILNLEKKLGSVSDGLKAAKRIAEEEAEEVDRLRKLYMDKISEAERLRETIADLVGQNCDLETKDQLRRRNNKRKIQEMKKELEVERKQSRNLENELSSTRRRLLTFTRRSVPRKSTRLIRRIDSYEDGTESTVSVGRATDSEDNETTRMSKLINVMNNF